MTNLGHSPEAKPPTSKASSVGRLILNSLVFVAVCTLLATTASRLGGYPEVSSIYPKWDYFQKHRDDYDFLFLGSSRVNHQIIPHQFDAAMRAGGQKVRSFNFGWDGMFPPESLHLLRQILASRPPHLKWVVIELMAIDTHLDEQNSSAQRAVYWHDFRHTELALRDILNAPTLWREKLPLLLGHTRLGVSQMFNLGWGAQPLERWLNGKPVRLKSPRPWEQTAGFDPGPNVSVDVKERRSFLAFNERLKRQVDCPLDAPLRQAMREIVEEVRQAGAEPIFFLPPRVRLNANFTEAPGDAVLFSFNDPERYPTLFNPDNYYDTAHLNEKGAAEFTAAFAQRLLEQLGKAPHASAGSSAQ